MYEFYLLNIALVLQFARNQLTFSFWSICGDTIENVDQDKEKGDEQSHPSGNDIGRNDKTDPGDHDE